MTLGKFEFVSPEPCEVSGPTSHNAIFIVSTYMPSASKCCKQLSNSVEGEIPLALYTISSRCGGISPGRQKCIMIRENGQFKGS